MIPKKKAFLDYIVPAAVKTEERSWVPAEVTVIQGILESAWGQSRLALEGKNLYGIKDQDGDSWKGAFVKMVGWEVIRGKKISEVMKWRKYETWDASTDDHARFFAVNRRYAEAMKIAQAIMDARQSGKTHPTWVDFAREMIRAGYATDPKYVANMISIEATYGIAKLCQAERDRREAERKKLEAAEAAKKKETPVATPKKETAASKPHWAAGAAAELAQMGLIQDPDPAKLGQPIDRGTVLALILAVVKFLKKDGVR